MYVLKGNLLNGMIESGRWNGEQIARLLNIMVKKNEKINKQFTVSEFP